MLVVVLASATIRLNGAAVLPLLGDGGIGIARGVHRTAASLEVLAAVWLAWMAWRGGELRKPVGMALAFTVFLSVLGIVAGRTPSGLQALGNVLGGLALAATFAWVLGKIAQEPSRVPKVPDPFPLVLAAALLLQTGIGARLSIFGRAGVPALPLHALLGLAIAGLLAWLALARIGGGTGRLLFALALASPIAGFTALEHEYSVFAALVHAAGAALLVATTAFTLSRNA